MSQDEALNSEGELLKSLYLILLYVSGGDEHNPFLAETYPERPNSRDWHSKETFVDLHCWIGLDFDILNELEELGFLEQPQKGRRKQRTYVRLNKKGMQHAREMLEKIHLSGAKEALGRRSHHKEYIEHKSRIDLLAEEKDAEIDVD